VAHVVGIRRDFLDTLLVAGQVAVVAPLAATSTASSAT